jgi:hypothetical protein
MKSNQTVTQLRAENARLHGRLEQWRDCIAPLLCQLAGSGEMVLERYRGHYSPANCHGPEQLQKAIDDTRALLRGDGLL